MTQGKVMVDDFLIMVLQNAVTRLFRIGLKKVFMILISIFCYSNDIVAQTVFKGKVLDAESRTPLPTVTIVNQLGNEWTVSAENGEFELIVQSQKVLLEFSLLGKKKVSFTEKEIKNPSNIIVLLQDQNLWLDEVTVTAKSVEAETGSTIVLDEYAIDQIQAISLADVLQQLPGQTIAPPQFRSINTISLRTAIPDATNSLGVAFVMDGVRLSNDENMQLYADRNLTANDNVNTGVDLRSIPTSNIDRVEIISGIPNARYGNLNSGVVNVIRKAGVSPYELKASIRDGNTLISLSKGTRLSKRLGTLSFSIDFLNSNADPRQSLEKFNRITNTALWSIKRKGFKNTFSMSFSGNIDDTNFDEDDGSQRAKSRKDWSFRFSNRTNYQLNKTWVDDLELIVSYSYRKQHSYLQSFSNTGGRVVPTSTVSGLFEGAYTPVAYLSVREVFGTPIRASGELRLFKTFASATTTHVLEVGGNINYSDNRGSGTRYGTGSTHFSLTLSGGGSAGSQNGVRALNFEEHLRPQINYGFYIQDDINIKFANGHELNAEIGGRLDLQNEFLALSPRVNIGYRLNKKVVVKGGVGFATKTPTLAQLYPGNRYFDILIGDFRTNAYAYNLVQTYVREFGKLDLKPSKSWRYEIGTEVKTSFGTITATAYRNELFDAFVEQDFRELVDFPIVDFQFTNNQTPPTHQVTGYEPFILDYSLTTNAAKRLDKGIEIFVNVKKIKPINTSFLLRANYTHSTAFNNRALVERNQDQLEEELLYGVYEDLTNRQANMQLALTATHHISEVGLLLSFTVEQFLSTTNYGWTRNNYPIAYLDKQLVYHAIPEGERDDPRYLGLLRPSLTSGKQTIPMYHNFHLRLTKEFKNGLSMSFYTYNFLNYRPVLEIDNRKEVFNQPISFGASMNYEF